MGKSKIRDIKIIEREGPYRFERIEVSKYDEIKRDWEEEFGITLPPRSGLSVFGNLDDLRIVLAPITITIYFKDRRPLRYEFDRGFITDLASVPKAFRSIVDNDDLKLLGAALVHDYNFTTWFLGPNHKGCLRANKLFYGMIRKQGYGLGKSIIAFLSVNSIVGRARYQHNIRRDPWTEKTARSYVL